MPRPSSYAVFCLKKKKTGSSGAPSLRKCLAVTYYHGVGIGMARLCHYQIASLILANLVPIPALPFLSATRLKCLAIRKGVNGFVFNDTPPPEIYTLSLHDALPI